MVAVRRLPINIDVLCLAVDFVAGWLSLLYSQTVSGAVAGTILQYCLATYGNIIPDSKTDASIYVNYARWLVATLAVLLPEVMSPGKDGKSGKSRCDLCAFY